jgi:hypothetical protein
MRGSEVCLADFVRLRGLSDSAHDRCAGHRVSTPGCIAHEVPDEARFGRVEHSEEVGRQCIRIENNKDDEDDGAG